MPDLAPLLTGDPSQVAGYRLTGRIGAGGQGVVFLGIAPDGERVAVKMLRVEDDRSRQQFAKEVANARRVAPFCTAQILDFDMGSPSPYVISEFIEGPSLQQYVAERGPLTGTRLQRLAIGTATALAAIHQAGVVHRDLKPANVMMSPEGPRVIDFGIARDLDNETTIVSKLFGTPAYMSPEQLRAERVGPATDMFAWGSVMTFAATGRAPFEAGHMMAAIAKIANEQPDLTGVPADLLAVLRHCFHKDAARRPTAQQSLSMLLGHPAETTPPDTDVVLAEATQFVVASSTGPTEGYSDGRTVANPDARYTQAHPSPPLDPTRVERLGGPATGRPGTGTTGPVSPTLPAGQTSGDVPAWGTPVPGGRPRRAPAGSPPNPNPPFGQPQSAYPPPAHVQPSYQPGVPPAENQQQSQWGQSGPNGPVGQNGQRSGPVMQNGRQSGPVGQNGQQLGPNGPVGQNGQQAGPVGPNGRWSGPNGPSGPQSGWGHQPPQAYPAHGNPHPVSHPALGHAQPQHPYPQPPQNARQAASPPEAARPQYPQPGRPGRPGQPGQSNQPGWGQPGQSGQLGQSNQPGRPGQSSPSVPPPPIPGPGQRVTGGGQAPPPQRPVAPGWNQPQPWGNGNLGGPGQQPPRSRTAPNRRPVVLTVAASVVVLVVGLGVWGSTLDDETASGDSTSSSGEKGGKIVDPEVCGDRINVGADSDCTPAESSGGAGSSGEDSSKESGSSGSSGNETEADEEAEDTSDRQAPTGTLPYPLEGVWEGTVSQPSGSTPEWDVRLDLTGGKKRTGTMTMIDLGCTSKLTVKNAGFSTATLRAPVRKADDPNGICARLGEVILIGGQSDEDEISFTWQDQSNASNVALATLERVE